MRICTHKVWGGVSTCFDAYGVRKKLGLKVYKFRHICWDCWDQWGEKLSKKIRKQTEQVIADRGLCRFLEAYRGYCLNKLPCNKHKNVKCFARGCGKPATKSCSETRQFVCGAPECDDHSHCF